MLVHVRWCDYDLTTLCTVFKIVTSVQFVTIGVKEIQCCQCLLLSTITSVDIQLAKNCFPFSWRWTLSRTTLNEIPLTTQATALLMTLVCFDDTQSNSGLQEAPVFSRQRPLGNVPAHFKRSRMASRGGFMSARAPGLSRWGMLSGGLHERLSWMWYAELHKRPPSQRHQ